MSLKALLPNPVKLKIRLMQRFFKDKSVDFATAIPEKAAFSNSISTRQQIMPGTFYDNKVHNIKTGAIKIASVQMQPNQVFSFWKIVGAPNERNGFKKGRNIVKGKVSEEIGGGLCQLSSIVYTTALKANLKITERYNHSVDIYKEEDRFTPLGSDATVVYGYKDLRFENNFPFPIQFSFSFFDDQIVCNLESLEAIEEKKLNFIRNYKEKHIEVATTINSEHHCISVYEIMAL